MDVILHLTQDCQLDCAYCYGGRKLARAMSWDTAQRAIDLMFERATAGTPPKLSFFGGEPLLEMDLIRRCADHVERRSVETRTPCRMEVATNGLLADESTIHYLRHRQIEPTLSFDGVPAAQDAARRRRDGASSFAETNAAMSRLLASFPNLMVCAVVSPENVPYLPETIDFLLEAGVQRLVLNPNFFGAWDEAHLDLWRRGYEHAADRFIAEFRQGRVIHLSFITSKIITHLKGGYDPCDCCDFGLKEIAVAPSGNVYPCQRMVGEDHAEFGLLGNVFAGLSPESCAALADARQATNPECLQCDLRRRCRNWCSCVNHRLTGRFDRTGPLVCLHERMAIEIADRAASLLFQEQNTTFMETFYAVKEVAPEWV